MFNRKKVAALEDRIVRLSVRISELERTNVLWTHGPDGWTMLIRLTPNVY